MPIKITQLVQVPTKFNGVLAFALIPNTQFVVMELVVSLNTKDVAIALAATDLLELALKDYDQEQKEPQATR